MSLLYCNSFPPAHGYHGNALSVTTGSGPEVPQPNSRSRSQHAAGAFVQPANIQLNSTLSGLLQSARCFMESALAPSTRSAYSIAWSSFTTFYPEVPQPNSRSRSQHAAGAFVQPANIQLNSTLSGLLQSARCFMESALAPSTRSAYSIAWSSFTTFYAQNRISHSISSTSWPLSHISVCHSTWLLPPQELPIRHPVSVPPSVPSGIAAAQKSFVSMPGVGAPSPPGPPKVSTN
ncbi:UNVERIFIED_CONTAM: hypothetical protein FKN15_076393 [Acipenser sinensis]